MIRKNNIDETRINETVHDDGGVRIKNKKPAMMKIKKILLVILLVVAVGGAFGSVHYYGKYQALKTNANIEVEKETNRLVGILGKLMELPLGETPTVATISDKEKLTGQAFFEKAENGDILFAYTNAMKAILYRPSTNKIINVAPITINQSQAPSPVSTVENSSVENTTTLEKEGDTETER